MKSLKYIFIGALIIISGSIIAVTYINTSYAAGIYTELSGKAGSYTLNYYDATSGHPLTCAIANEFYGEPKYASKTISNNTYYFYNCKQINKSEYDTGYPREQADIRAKNKGKSGIRVKTTAEAKAALDNIYKNLKTGTYYLEFSPNENINWDEVQNYYLDKYGVTDYRKNYYDYAHKGEIHTARYKMYDIDSRNTGTIEVDTTVVRITGDEKQVASNFVNKLLPYLKGDGSDYQRILATAKYITNNTSYFVDDGYDNFLDSNTSIYDVFILRQSNCIGYSIAFSYVMDIFGIESYIVDDIVQNDPVKEILNSVHTYNVVKLDGKFYIVDLTGGRFLTGVSSSTLYDNKLPISSTTYNFAGKPTNYTFESGLYNKILNEVKQTKTTTTTKQKYTTTKQKTTSYEGQITTQRLTTEARKTTTDIEYPTAPSVTSNTTTTTSTTTTTYNQEFDPIPEMNTTTNTSNVINTSQKTTEITEENPNKTTVNIILILVGAVTIIFYIIYSMMKKNTKNDTSTEIDKILQDHYNQRK